MQGAVLALVGNKIPISLLFLVQSGRDASTVWYKINHFENNYFTEMCSGSEAGSYLRLIDFLYHSTLGLRVIKKRKKNSLVHVSVWTDPRENLAFPTIQVFPGELFNLLQMTQKQQIAKGTDD